jgi:uncharacterized linocin/CFP29 family protein
LSHLLRRHAPITTAGWERIDEEARDRLTPGLAARKLVDFRGPLGWEYSATSLGRIEPVKKVPFAGIEAVRRRVLPLVELRADFALSRGELADGDRGAEDVDFASLDRAALNLATAENASVFHGWPSGGILGMAETSTHRPITLGEDCNRYPRHVAAAVDALLSSGIAGPYGMALGPAAHQRVLETSENGGYPLLEHLREILGGSLVWAPGVTGAVVMSLRGGDFLFESGQDISVGFDRVEGDAVHLYLEESFSFRVVTPEAAVILSE